MLVTKVSSLLEATAQEVASETIPLKVLHAVIQRKDSFVALLSCIGCKTADAAVIDAKTEELKGFDGTLEQVGSGVV